MMWRALVFAAAAGCYSPSYQNCEVTCGQTMTCPSGLSCISGVCMTAAGSCGATDDTQTLGTWGFRKRVTIGRAALNQSVTDFPVLIRLAGDSDLSLFAQPGGQDIKFQTIDGQPLAHEIERYTSGSGGLVAWVKVPMLSPTSMTAIYMYYGNPLAADQQQRNAVWDSNYLGVWHFGDAPSATLVDSTTFMRMGTKAAANAPSSVEGMIGGGQLFSGNADFVEIGNAVELDSPELTFEAWMNVHTNTIDERRIYDAPTTFAIRTAISYPGTAAPAGTNPHSVIMQASTTFAVMTAAEALVADTWIHLVVQPGPGTAAMPPIGFSNGTLQTNSSSTFILAQDSARAAIGGRPNVSGHAIDGMMDEVRISRVKRTPGWITTSYENQKAGSTFVTLAAPEAL